MTDEIRIPLPTDEHGRIARECPEPDCAPGYFKVKSGTGIVDGQTTAYCPYCRHEAPPDDFTTREQIRFAEEAATQEVERRFQGAIRNGLGLGPSGTKTFGGGMFSMEMRFKPGPLSPVHRPFEEEVRRDVVCPHCGLDHAVFGVAVWCPDCGKDIFLTHVQAELAVVTFMLADVDRRRSALGYRVAARDLENCLEDAVSIFEAVMKALVTRRLRQVGTLEEDVQSSLRKIGNAFQSISRTADTLKSQFGLDLQVPEHSTMLPRLGAVFEKRHPITHNLGVIDKKYLERALSAGQEGRDVLVVEQEIQQALSDVLTLVRFIHAQLIGGQQA